MEPGAQLSLFTGAWRHPAMNMVSQAAYRYNQNMMEYYTCKNIRMSNHSDTDVLNCNHFESFV